MDWRERIEANPKVLVGKPVIKGTRLAVEFVLELLAEGWTHERILTSYSQLTEEDIRAALFYAAESTEHRSPPGVGDRSLDQEMSGLSEHRPDPLDSVIGMIEGGPDFSSAERHDAILYGGYRQEKGREP